MGIAHALTIIARAIGEWSYYILGSAVEVALLALAAVVYYAWTWPRETRPASPTGRDATAHDIQPIAP